MTAAIEVLEGYRQRDAGRVSVLGFDPWRSRRRFRRRIGIVLQESTSDPYLKVTEALEQRARYYPSPRPIGEVVELMGLAAKRQARVKTLSGGQQRRLDVAMALVGDPDLLFLDKPTTGFEPSARRDAGEVIANLPTLGKTILLTTHHMDEAQALANELAVVVADLPVPVAKVQAQTTGDDPGRFGVSVQECHYALQERQARWPLSLNATSTHDTKRSEDVRARIHLLAEMPELCGSTVRRWAAGNKRRRRDDMPSRNDEYFLYETLVVAWPIAKDRLSPALVKSAWEAKRHTSWQSPNLHYERVLVRLADRCLGDPEFRADLEGFVAGL